MSYDDDLAVTNYPRFQARVLTKTIRSMSPERREVLATYIQFKEPKKTKVAAHLVALLQGKKPQTSLETLLREAQK